MTKKIKKAAPKQKTPNRAASASKKPSIKNASSSESDSELDWDVHHAKTRRHPLQDLLVAPVSTARVAEDDYFYDEAADLKEDPIASVSNDEDYHQSPNGEAGNSDSRSASSHASGGFNRPDGASPCPSVASNLSHEGFNSSKDKDLQSGVVPEDDEAKAEIIARRIAELQRQLSLLTAPIAQNSSMDQNLDHLDDQSSKEFKEISQCVSLSNKSATVPIVQSNEQGALLLLKDVIQLDDSDDSAHENKQHSGSSVITPGFRASAASTPVKNPAAAHASTCASVSALLGEEASNNVARKLIKQAGAPLSAAPNSAAHRSSKNLPEANVPASASEQLKSNTVGIGGGPDQPSQKAATNNAGTQFVGSFPVIARVKMASQPKTHNERVAYLLHAGWPFADVISALDASKDEKGEENIDQAQDHLENLREWRFRQIKQSQIKTRDLTSDDAPPTIAEDSDIARFVAVHPSRISAVLLMREVHLNQQSHNSNHALVVANLMLHARVVTATTGIPEEQVNAMAYAVVMDCESCVALREKDYNAKKEAIKQAKEAEEQAKAEASRKARAEANQRLKEENAKRKRDSEASKRSKTPPLPPTLDESYNDEASRQAPFDQRDSLWSSKKRRGTCWQCGAGDLGGNKSLLNICESCGRGYHADCTQWKKLQHSRTLQRRWGCLACFAFPSVGWIVMDETNSNDKDQQQDPSTPKSNPRPSLSGGLGSSSGGGGGDGGGGGGDGATPNSPSAFFSGGSNHLRDENGQNQANLSHKVRAYVLWEPLPKGHPIEVEHSNKGFGSISYSNWKKVNTSLRDQSGGILGPLTNALTTQMRTSVGNALIQNFAFHPRPNMNGTEISAWLKKDPDYNWVKGIRDEVLLRQLDTHFSVNEAEPFLSMRFPDSIPQISADGTVNYMNTAHSAFAEQWLDALRELRQSGWDESAVDLRQTYISALETCPTLYNKAISSNTKSFEMLISDMRFWTQKKTSNQASEKQHKSQLQAALLHKAHQHATPAQQTIVAPTPSQTKRSDTKEVKALRTELALLKQQSASAGGKPSTFFCNGCGYTFQRDGRRIPCESSCIFEDHAEHNTGYKTGVRWPENKRRLYWGSPAEYQTKFGKEMPEKGKQYLEYRAKQFAKRPETERKP